MPVGMPKVPFRMPEEEDATWVELYNALFRQRRLLLFQKVGIEAALQLCGAMIFLRLEDHSAEISLYINSVGGSILPGLAIFDTIQCTGVSTVCVSLAASMGSFLLVGGPFKKRAGYAHSKVMVHQPASTYCDESTGAYGLEIHELIWIRYKVTESYAQQTGQPLEIICHDLEREIFMSAEEAQAHGAIDRILPIGE
uniref:ATP-dependent Clp protease proteolytic subunit n=2 Tax=Thymelaeaceae TaxID=39987 RepID=A0A0U2TDK8_9ROSI|nr:ATP-dependent Clp protease proteolytic subunit [Aquilaria sinensis]YP_010250821.1 ATP-dependent Clp protease proteolytic subunit 1 [Gyrinops walla]YP_010427369.1 ATP-dependent Clp protease proteolytic subunit 1 [Aquilaria agallochum]YP_010427463.1 ATP-dependent Clp protease proteolytic subunit 1 [Aquilaria cumingiana]YP_010427557.1 ATP-dependent Clp protease proteolytic subunit 1 [Aquilaria rugosa]YP_010427651.1 ATP-dependent Clp protease proteolytic subunit 1 [Gyrinops caudata]YP_01042774